MEGRGFYNVTLAFLQSILVSFLAYVLIAISETDIVLDTVFVLFSFTLQPSTLVATVRIFSNEVSMLN